MLVNSVRQIRQLGRRPKPIRPVTRFSTPDGLSLDEQPSIRSRRAFESSVNNATSWTDRPRNPVTLAAPNAVVPIAPVPMICLPPSGRRSPLGLYPTTPSTAAGVSTDPALSVPIPSTDPPNVRRTLPAACRANTELSIIRTQRPTEDDRIRVRIEHCLWHCCLRDNDRAVPV
ncbi:hypothetical protein N7497_008203 [Penicillium chrysogenum]|nr:hypothetical protein N7497_008203 [Penicillium chrysogenum]